MAGVAKGHNGSVWLFERGSRVWDAASFTGSRAEHVTYTSAIEVDTIQQLDQDTGNMFSFAVSSTFISRVCIMQS